MSNIINNAETSDFINKISISDVTLTSSKIKYTLTLADDTKTQTPTWSYSWLGNTLVHPNCVYLGDKKVETTYLGNQYFYGKYEFEETIRTREYAIVSLIPPENVGLSNTDIHISTPWNLTINLTYSNCYNSIKNGLWQVNVYVYNIPNLIQSNNYNYKYYYTYYSSSGGQTQTVVNNTCNEIISDNFGGKTNIIGDTDIIGGFSLTNRFNANLSTMNNKFLKSLITLHITK
jgi:hypothetical protein